MANVFKRGYKVVQEAKKQQEEDRANSSMQLWRFFISKDGDEADLRFLTEEPVNFYEHTNPVVKNGKSFYENITCMGEDCPECANDSRPTFKGAYLVVDRREYSYKKDGKEMTGKDQVRLYVQGTKALSQLDRISAKYGLSNRDVTVVRLGTGTSTSYTFERGEESKLSTKEIEQLLPESIRKQYDGTMESLYKIVEEQLALSFPKGYTDEEEEEEDSKSSAKEEKKARSRIVSMNDDDDDDDEEEEEEIPVRRAITSKPLIRKPRENSIKKLLKKK